MKNYFSFKLDGGRIFPYYIAMWVALFIFIIAYFTLLAPKMAEAINIYSGEIIWSTLIIYYVSLFLLYVVKLLCLFPMTGLFLNSFSYNNIPTKFDARYSSYLLMIFKGLFLTIITLGIYGFWFSKDYTKFFVNNTSYNGKKFEFKGKALVLLAYVLIPLILYIVFIVIYAYALYLKIIVLSLFGILLAMLALFTMIYLNYKWYINLKYDGMTIKFKKGIDVYGVLFVSGQILLGIITLCFYAPAMEIRLFRYFANRTIVTDEEGNEIGKLGCDLKMSEDFWYVFGQILLVVITLFIYTPWAYCFITERFTSKTYIEKQ